MADTGKTFKRCGCRNGRGQRLEQNCPRLAERGHGSWQFHCSAPNLFGCSERIRRGGFPSQAAARAARDETLADSAARRSGDGWTLERWLRHWLDTAPGSGRPPAWPTPRDVELVLIPHLGHYRLSDLDGPLLRAVFAEIAQTTNTKGLPQSASEQLGARVVKQVLDSNRRLKHLAETPGRVTGRFTPAGGSGTAEGTA